MPKVHVSFERLDGKVVMNVTPKPKAEVRREEQEAMTEVWCTICGARLVKVTKRFADLMYKNPGKATAVCEVCRGLRAPK